MDANEKFSLAFKHFQEGSLKQAERDCLEILSEDPENSEVLHLLGITYYHLGEHDRSVEYLEKAAGLEASNPDIFYDLGNVFHDQGNLEAALRVYEKALDIEPAYVDAHNNLGMVLHDLGQIDRAIAHYQRALELNPQSAMIHNNIALVYQEKEEYQKAIAHYGRALQIDPNFADAYFNMGNIFVRENNLDTAYKYFLRSIKINPNLGEAYAAAGQLLIRTGKFAEAVPMLGKALQFTPDSAEIHNNLGNAFGEIWQMEEAIRHLERAVQLNPELGEARANLGNSLFKMGKLDEGMKEISKALQLNPELMEAVNNLGNIHKEKGEFREAATCYRKALLLDPNNADAYLNLSLVDLLLGQFEPGWRGYEFRWKVKGVRNRRLPQPLWDGSPLNGKSLFVYAEQGIGDEIMYASCLPEMAAKAEMLIAECDKRLVPLFERSFPEVRFTGRFDRDGYPADLPPADFRIAIGSLPRFLRPSLASFPARKSYLVPERGKVEEWTNRYRDLGDGLIVGISWRGGSTPDVIRIRSTTLDQWADLFTIAGVRFINLQYGDCAEELKQAEDNLGVKIHDWDEAIPLADLDSFAAKIAALDLVISADNSTVHMAGALGVPVWVLLPYVCEWRWMLDFEDTPWYDSVRLFRQERRGEWAGVFERVLTALRDSAGAGKVNDIKVAKSYKTQIGS